MMTKDSLIAWASGWVHDEPEGQRARFVETLTRELARWRLPEQEPVGCKNCPFTEHVHYEENGKLVAPGCSGFEAVTP